MTHHPVEQPVSVRPAHVLNAYVLVRVRVPAASAQTSASQIPVTPALLSESAIRLPN